MYLIVTYPSEATQAFLQQHARLIFPGVGFHVWLWKADGKVLLDDMIAACGTDYFGCVRLPG